MEIFNIENILGALVNSFAQIYIWSKLLKKQINFKDYKYYVIQVLLAIVMLLNYMLVNGFIKLIFLILFIALFTYWLFKPSINETILVSFISEIIMMISELVFLLILTVIKSTNISVLINLYCGTLQTNLIISAIAILVSKLKIWNTLFNKMLSYCKTIKVYSLFIIISLLLVSVNFIFLSIYYKYNLSYIIPINVGITIVYIFICFKFLKAESNYSKINDKYNNTLNSLKEYEDILDVYRVSNHENKNQLLMIRNMIIKGEKDIPEYIDKIIDNKIKDDEKLMFDTNKIPAGGLRAVVYSKLLVMKDEKIDFNLIVDRKVRTVDLIELGESLMLDVCRITGVFLDNAIEEVKNKDNKKIIVELFTDEDKFCIKISNNFSGSINIEKIYDKGYTTKTDGHGYGLSLVKEIIEKNNKLTNMTSLENGMFTQILEIKVK